MRRGGVLLLCLLPAAWSAAALWLDGPGSRPIAAVLALAAALAIVAAPQFARGKGTVIAVATFAIVVAWWMQLQPRNDRHWLPDVAHPPVAQISGDRVTVHNVRDFEYRSETDYTAHWETRDYALSQVKGVDLFLSYWGSPWIAHTILSWEFEDGRHLAISIETRKEAGEAYSAVLGFFRQYELYYVVADERDLIGLRTAYRGERVYLYRIRATPEQARALLVDYLDRATRLSAQPAWYNALTHNCTTTIRLHVQDIGMRNPWNWRLLVNGKIDRLLYARGMITNVVPFDALRTRSDITDAGRDTPIVQDFSRRIRVALPERPIL